MLTKQLEQKIEKDLKWKKIEDIPNFPFKNFEEAKQKISSNEFSADIDFTTSNQFAEFLYGKTHTYFFLLLASAPIIVAVLSVVLAMLLNNHWLLIGIVLGFLGQFTSNPYNPSKGFFNLIASILFLVFVWALWTDTQTAILLTAFYVFPFCINKFIYKYNRNKLRTVSLNSEKIFIFLHQNGKLGLKNNSTNKTYWDREAAIQEVEKYLKR